MAPSQEEAELCSLLVDEMYGELPSRIFTALLHRGRLQLRTLATLTRLTLRQLQCGLAVLVQQNLAYYLCDSDTGATHYEASIGSAYALIRSGKIAEIIESRYGPAGRELILNLIELGHTKISDLLTTCRTSLQPRKEESIGVNGLKGHTIYSGKSSEDLDAVLSRLLEAGFIEVVTEKMFQSPGDIVVQVEQELLHRKYGGSARGFKQKEGLKEGIKIRVAEFRSAKEDWRAKGVQRKADDNPDDTLTGDSKRRKLSAVNGTAHHSSHARGKSVSFNPELVVRVDYERCTVALRSLRLAEFVKDKIGVTTSYLYAEVLRLLEEKIPRCQESDGVDDSPSITLFELELAVSPSINVALGIGKATSDEIDVSNLDKIHTSVRNGRANEIETKVDGAASSDEVESARDAIQTIDDSSRMEIDVNGDDVELPDLPHMVRGAQHRATPAKRAVTFEDNSSMSRPQADYDSRLVQMKNHLLLLTAHTCGFLRKCGQRGYGEWTVDFDILIERLKESELEETILENFGPYGFRLVRMLRKFGKVEERQLMNLALMKHKDIRTKLAELHKAGIVDLQPIPKDASHMATRTIWLWCLDKERVTSVLLNRAYKTMLRCYQRLEVEKRRSDVLEVMERTDVKSMGAEAVMNASQLKKLEDIVAKERTLLAQIGRLDDVVGVLRDY